MATIRISYIINNSNEYIKFMSNLDSLKSEIKELIQKRCGYADCYRINERIKINKDHLSAAIKSSFNLNKDRTFLQLLFKNN